MLFSVLMSHYNNARFLDAAIKSALDQSYPNWEIILVDDGSTDEFEDVISSFKNDKRIKVYRNGTNMGCAYSKRKCVEKSTGDIAGFLDPDDMLHPDAIKIMIDAHIQKASCSLIHSTHYVCDEALAIIRIAEYPKALPENTPYLLLNDGSIHHFATFKKSCYDKTVGISLINKFDKAVDQDLYYLLEETGSIYFVNELLYYYRIHQGGISTYQNTALAQLAHYDIIEKACIRRINKLKTSNEADAGYWIKKYKTRYHKMHLFNSYCQKKWVSFITGLITYPFNGGLKNIVSYLKKIPKEGTSLLKKSFAHS